MAADVVTLSRILAGDPPQPASLLGIARLVETGLPLAALDRVLRAVAPDDARFVASIVPKATLTRRRATPSGALSAEESNKVARLAKVWAMALSVWKDEDDAREFLSRPHPMLEGRPPREVAVGSDPGADAVVNIIGRGAYGGGV